MKEKYFNILTKKELKKIKKTYIELFREFDVSLLKIICLKELKINNDDSESAHEVYAYLQYLTDSIKLSSFDTSNVTNAEGMFAFNLAYKNNKVKFKNDIDFTKKAKTKEIEEIEEKIEKTKPSYYQLKNIEVFDFIDEFELNFNIGNVAKYIARYKNKNGLEDLEKAEVYLKREIDKLKKGDCK